MKFAIGDQVTVRHAFLPEPVFSKRTDAERREEMVSIMGRDDVFTVLAVFEGRGLVQINDRYNLKWLPWVFELARGPW